MHTLQDVLDLCQYHAMKTAIFGSSAAAKEISDLMLGLGDQIAADNGLTNYEAARDLPPNTPLSALAEDIFWELKKRAYGPTTRSKANVTVRKK